MNNSKLISKLQKTTSQDKQSFIIKKVISTDLDYLALIESTLNEWTSSHDEEDYSDL